MPLYSFLHSVPINYNFQILSEIIKSELLGITWLLRPALIQILRRIWLAYEAGLIDGAFIYSNNGSETLVTFARLLCDGIIEHFYPDRYRPFVFKMGIWYNAPCRTRGSLVKSFEEIQKCLAAHKLPQMTTPDDLLFFDDLEHVLQGQITHYVRVRPYFNYTSVYTLIEVLGFLESYVGEKEWKETTEAAARFQIKDMKERENHYILTAPDRTDTEKDKVMFNDALDRFLGVMRRGPRTRRVRSRRGRKSRRINRRLK